MPFCPTCGTWHPGDFGHHRPYHHVYLGPYYQRLMQTGGRSDEEIGRDVVDALVNDPWVDSRRVHVAVEGGVITLEGKMGSAVEKRSADADAWDVPGVVDVQNRLEIEAS